MARCSVCLLAVIIAGVQAQSDSSTAGSTTTDAAFSYTQDISYVTTTIPTTAYTGGDYTYLSYTGQSTVVSAAVNSASKSGNSSTTLYTSTTQTLQLTELAGAAASSTTAGNASSTTSSTTATNTVPCNNYAEFCNRKYSNITQVCSHNSAFVEKDNAASNQVLTITQQLDDGIRMLQGETHYYNNSMYNCHTSCDLLNVGPWQESLETLVTWLQSNPYDVVTWLIVNSDFVNVENYTSAIENSGIKEYLYEPEYIPQRRDQWPTLGEMILSGKRVVMFMDYDANQTAVPYILDEFTHMWETPFSPTNQSFPCTLQRPPGLNLTTARDQYMYLANHNLNVAISLDALLGTTDDETLLIPNTADINQTNGEYNQYGQLGANALNCTADWGLPPTWLLVDYYNYGTPSPGSVFEVAAQMNGVTYTGVCCGTTDSSGVSLKASMLALAAAVGFASLLLL